MVFSLDARWLCFSDKYGIVHVTSTDAEGDPSEGAASGPQQLLAHCCSIITSLVGTRSASLATWTSVLRELPASLSGHQL